MADAVVTVAIETICEVLVEEGKFLLGVREQVEELQGELEVLKSFLKDANAKKHEQDRVHTCVSQAKRLAYKAEDIIEEYAIKVASKRGGGFRKVARRAACIVGEGSATHKVGNEIQKIKADIGNLNRRLENYGINRIIEAQPTSETIEQQRRQRTTYSHEVDEYFVGMKDDVSKIIRWVTEDDKIRRVISICGTGGLGKTTIARKVFNHIKKSSERSFECFAWVSVTQQCQVKMLLQDILNQILGDKIGDKGGEEVCYLEEQKLVRKLYDVLKYKKCFVVLDDMWKLEDWKSLSPAFPTLEGSSKILLTTRITEVAGVAHPRSQHKPELLDEKDGWDLLTKIALNLQEDQGNTLPETVKNVGTYILHKCGGLPLAISVLGGILRNKNSLAEWENVNNKFPTHVGMDGGVVSLLALSYDDLPSHLKPCFLYMGCFREAEEIDVTRLYLLWLAEGLLSTGKKGPDVSPMDVASDFLHELICRNMVQPIVISDEEYKSCRLHDLMRELCLTKGKEEEFLEVKSIQISNDEVGSICIDSVDLHRKTILIDSKYKCKISIANPAGETCFRALIFNQRYACTIEGTMKFKRLRSLIFDNCRFKDLKLPKEIKDMIHLRYLSLRNSLRNGELPAFVGDLQYIQILDVSDNYKVQLPNIFHKMKRLRCLYLPSHRVKPKSGKRLEFHGLNELEVVESLNSECDQFTHLLESVNLHRLKANIYDYEDLSTILKQLSSMLKATPRRSQNQISVQLSIYFRTEDSVPEDVKKLLLCCCVRNLDLCSPIGEFPRYEHHFWPNLVSLTLSHTEFVEDPMAFLQELPTLRALRMVFDPYVGKEMYCSSKAFPQLTELQILGLHNIEKWRVDDGAFPNLQSLYIRDCESFEEIVPDGLTNITSLTLIDMDGMPEEFRNKYGSLPNSTTTDADLSEDE